MQNVHLLFIITFVCLSVPTYCQGWGEGMRRGLSCAGEWALLIKNKTKQTNKTTLRGETVLQAGKGKARKGKAGTGYNWGRYDDEQDCKQDFKHKEIIKRANEEGNEGQQLRKMNQ